MEDYVIRKIKISEFNKCSNIWNFEKQKKLKDKFYEECLAGNRETFVFEKDNEFIGEISVVYEKDDPDYCIPGRRLYVSRLIVKKEFRNKGIGSLLIDYIIEYSQKKGYKELSIGVDKNNSAAVYLYKKKGFNKVIFEGEDEQGEYYKLLKEM